MLYARHQHRLLGPKHISYEYSTSACMGIMFINTCTYDYSQMNTYIMLITQINLLTVFLE